MKPGYSEKPDEKQEKESVARMKPGLLIQPDRNPCTGKKHSHSPSTEVPAGMGALRLHPLTAMDETKKRLFPCIGRGRFHKACGP
jgi:hypothetical protein